MYEIQSTKNQFLTFIRFYFKEQTMSDQISKTFQSYMMKEIKLRYAIIQGLPSRNEMSIIDTFAPCHILNELEASMSAGVDTYQMNTLRQTPNSFAISEGFASRFSVPLVPLEALIDSLGFSIDDIRNLMLEVKKLKYSIVFVGYGGTGLNTHHWLSKLSEMCKVNSIFVDGVIMDAEKVDFSNTLRFPIDLNKIKVKNRSTSGKLTFVNKIDLLPKYDRLFITRTAISSFLTPSFNSQVTRNRTINANYTSSSERDNSKYVTCNDDRIIFYGAPNIATREQLKNVNFIAGTHGDNECSLMVKPAVDAEMQHESYGIIQLNVFFMNQLRMAIALLEFLATKPNFKTLDNTTVFKYNFADEVINGRIENENFDIGFNISNVNTIAGT